jgi:hypothetical protein
MASDNPCYQHLSEKVRLAQILSGLLSSGPSFRNDRDRFSLADVSLDPERSSSKAKL